MRRGPKGKSPADLRAAGETRPSRTVAVLYPDNASRPDPEKIPPPTGMTPAGRKIWTAKVERYRQRGQKVAGFEDALRQLCELEAAINKAWKIGMPTMAMVTAHRLWMAEFFDTPAAQKVSPSGPDRPENRFNRNGKQD